ncbi:MAG: XcyI family restriction endonuclease [Chloroflexaceae bacterium]|nr:XcyI family restriction endonuclease [Chloroflexaceae bacterium]
MYNLPEPELQVGFSVALAEIRGQYLQEALSATIGELDIVQLDRELSEYVPKDSLVALAKHGLRGELVFPVPLVLAQTPRLLGYYRLLYGYSQKQFYSSQTGLNSFFSMEQKGLLTRTNKDNLSSLCKLLSVSGAFLLEGIGNVRISSGLLDDLTLLTLGPQLRGGANVKKGVVGIVKVFDLLHDIVKHAVVEVKSNRIEIRNAARRTVFIEFAADPDIIIREEMSPGIFQLKIAIEVKSGSDFANIHNRIGEAEKSHQKARAAGYVECWTVVNVDRIDFIMARKESPSTNHFYRISDLLSKKGTDYQDFRNRVISLTGIPFD